MFYNKDVRYIDKTHQYFDVKSGKELESVTTVLKKFQPEFEHDYWASFKATQEGVSKYRKDLEWHLLREHGTTKGSYIHDYLECATQGKYFEKPVPEFIYKPALDKCIELANQFVEWYRESKFSLVVPELIVNDNKNAGQIDNLSCVNNDLHKLAIVDYKTDKAIDFDNQYGNLLEPYSNMPDCNWSKYCLQVNKYQELFEKKFTDYRIIDRWIVWIYEENEEFKLLRVPDVEILF
jgi:hypothetical protein